jgi:hypothetical protein
MSVDANNGIAEARVDAFTAEVIRRSVAAITDEMKTNLMRTAFLADAFRRRLGRALERRRTKRDGTNAQILC